MKNKIRSIKELLPDMSSLPNGQYDGIWGGYIVEVRHNGRTYQLESEVGVRGMGIKVTVLVENGIATFN